MDELEIFDKIKTMNYENKNYSLKNIDDCCNSNSRILCAHIHCLLFQSGYEAYFGIGAVA